MGFCAWEKAVCLRDGKCCCYCTFFEDKSAQDEDTCGVCRHESIKAHKVRGAWVAGVDVCNNFSAQVED